MVQIFAIDEVYRFVDEASGENICIASRQCRQWVLDNRSALKLVKVPVEEKIAQRFLYIDRAVNEERVLSLGVDDMVEPLIYCKLGETDGVPDVLLMDGHHRYVRASLMDWPFLAAFILEREQWEPFRLRSQETAHLTVEEMRAIPPSHLPREVSK